MYSPKIREDLIPRIYAIAQEQGIAMTTWVNQVLQQALESQLKFAELNETIDGKETETHERNRTEPPA